MNEDGVENRSKEMDRIAASMTDEQVARIMEKLEAIHLDVRKARGGRLEWELVGSMWKASTPKGEYTITSSSFKEGCYAATIPEGHKIEGISSLREAKEICAEDWRKSSAIRERAGSSLIKFRLLEPTERLCRGDYAASWREDAWQMWELPLPIAGNAQENYGSGLLFFRPLQSHVDAPPLDNNRLS